MLQWMIPEEDGRHLVSLEKVIEKLKEAPTVDTEQHRKWIAPDNEVTDYWRCSVCGEEYYFEFNSPFENNMHYCPNCGAKMDGEIVYCKDCLWYENDSGVCTQFEHDELFDENDFCNHGKRKEGE